MNEAQKVKFSRLNQRLKTSRRRLAHINMCLNTIKSKVNKRHEEKGENKEKNKKNKLLSNPRFKAEFKVALFKAKLKVAEKELAKIKQSRTQKNNKSTVIDKTNKNTSCLNKNIIKNQILTAKLKLLKLQAKKHRDIIK